VRRQLVPARRDVAHETREALRHHAEGEEGRARAVRVEDVEETLGLGNDAAGQELDRVPAQSVHELVTVVVLLDVDGQDIDRRIGIRHASLR
jgi:hypothetical protein